MCHVLGDLIQDVCVVKIAHQELLTSWRIVFSALNRCNLRLSPEKTIICPASTTILGWIWSQGSIRASSHLVAVLPSCEQPKNVTVSVLLCTLSFSLLHSFASCARFCLVRASLSQCLRTISLLPLSPPLPVTFTCICFFSSVNKRS